ncbi:MAG: phospholipase D-like domain-containing protein [Spirochaetes bacterium]|nr:phospholipase D-like domain-containing protein [Spirochaetota bacterium]
MIKRNNLKIIFILILFLFSAGAPSAAEYDRWWSLFFTSPGIKTASDINPEKGMIKMISGSKKTFYGAFFEISSANIVKEMISAHTRGVDIRIVTDSDNFYNSWIRKLMDAGIPVIPDRRKGLMHNKFAVIDGEFVWTGSYNLTDNCTYRNNNNAILISSSELAEIYLDEFTEMFKHGIFGNKKESGVFADLRKKNRVKILDTDIEVYFSPENNIEEKILDGLQKSQESICFMAFSFTSDRIGEMIIDKFKRGVKVRGIFEKIGSNTKYSEYTKMLMEKIPVRIDKNRYRMHHKVIVIDGRTVITGSYNFSRSADEQNDENLLIIQNKEIAGQYLNQFESLYK